jgi:hypothetical protein
MFRTLLAGVLAAYAGITVDDFEAKSDAFLRSTRHPTLGRGYLECAFAPMVELLRYLEAHGFTNYTATRSSIGTSSDTVRATKSITACLAAPGFQLAVTRSQRSS